jgi:hypothetical protein
MSLLILGYLIAAYGVLGALSSLALTLTFVIVGLLVSLSLTAVGPLLLAFMFILMLMSLNQ